jgi:type II secretory pathway pseudopilin PulG
MKTIQKGFSAVEILITVLVIALLGTGFFFVSQRQDKKNKDAAEVQKVTYVSASDTANSFTFSYPSNWEMQPYEEWGIGGDNLTEEQMKEPDWTKVSRPISLQLIGNDKVTIDITMNEYGVNWSSFEEVKTMVAEDYFAKTLFEGTREDGHEALFTRVDYLGPPDAKVESFTDHRYYFNNDKYVLSIDFREKYHHDWPDDEMGPDIDNSPYLKDFEYIANSVKFTR